MFGEKKVVVFKTERDLSKKSCWGTIDLLRNKKKKDVVQYLYQKSTFLPNGKLKKQQLPAGACNLLMQSNTL